MRQYNITQIEDNLWGIIETDESGNARIVYDDNEYEYVECMLDEFRYFENARIEWDLNNNQESEFDYV